MRIPLLPPDVDRLAARLAEAPGAPARLWEIMARGVSPAPEGKYRHWDILRHLAPPPGLSSKEWWLGVKLARRQLLRELPLVDGTGAPFRYAPVDAMYRMLHRIDQQAGGSLGGSGEIREVVDPGSRDTYLMMSLFEEAITSSQLEGAATTREAAKDMLQRGRAPRNRSERMILNNFEAMQFIRQVAGQRLTPSMVFELHRILTRDTLDDPQAAGTFRREEDQIQVIDEVGQVLHRPPRAAELPERLDRLCALANDPSEEPFIHPVVRAILIHFALVYDHPFVDGNGRTARALFYWGLVSRGYWLGEFLSISRIIKHAPSRYYRAFLYSETDDRDVTYFVLNQLDVTVRAIQALHDYLARKVAEREATRRAVEQSRFWRTTLNPRQLALIGHALKHPGFEYSIQSHRRSHAVSYQTARTDLLALAEAKLLEQRKRGKMFLFYAPTDVAERFQARPPSKRPAPRRRSSTTG